MEKSDLKKEFFTNNEVLFVGYMNRLDSFCKMLVQGFTKNGIRVTAYNPKDNPNYDIKVYKSLDEIPNIPKTAYFLFNEDSTAELVNQLKGKGVNRILFHDAMTAKKEAVDECIRLGIETLVACPMMRLGKGLHRIHGFFAGVR